MLSMLYSCNPPHSNAKIHHTGSCAEADNSSLVSGGGLLSKERLSLGSDSLGYLSTRAVGRWAVALRSGLRRSGDWGTGSRSGLGEEALERERVERWVDRSSGREGEEWFRLFFFFAFFPTLVETGFGAGFSWRQFKENMAAHSYNRKGKYIGCATHFMRLRTFAGKGTKYCEVH